MMELSTEELVVVNAALIRFKAALRTASQAASPMDLPRLDKTLSDATSAQSKVAQQIKKQVGTLR